MKKLFYKYGYDYLGILGSGICLVHCLATPLIMLVQAYYKTEVSISSHEGIRYWDYIFLITCFVAVFFTTKESTSQKISSSFWLFFFFFAIAILFEDDFKYINLLGYFASVGLIITHIINIRNCRRCQTKNSPLQC